MILAQNKKAGASRRASALQALGAWGGIDEWPLETLVDENEDPLVRGSAILALARKGACNVEDVLVEMLADPSSVVARLAFEALGEVLGKDSQPRLKLERALIFCPPCDYWVVEKQRLLVIGEVAQRWDHDSTTVLRLGALDGLMKGLQNSDPRIRQAAAESLAVAAPYLGAVPSGSLERNASDSEMTVLEGVWKSVPGIMRRLMRRIRCFTNMDELLGAHQAMMLLAHRWCSPRRYLKRESARLNATLQRPLHASWPSPVHFLFSSYAARSVSELVARPTTLMCALDHHENVLQCCAALARGGGASSSSSWPVVLMHCLRVIRLYDLTADPMDVGDDIEVLSGGGVAYLTLQTRLNSLRSSSLPSETGAYFDLLKAALKVIANLIKDVGRPITTFGHFILSGCRSSIPLVPSASLSVCRVMAPLCFRPASASSSSSSSTSSSTSNASASTPVKKGGTATPNIMSPPATAPATPLPGTAAKPSGTTATPTTAAAARKHAPGLSVALGLAYASGLGRPAPVAEDFPAALNFSAARVEVALRLRPMLPALLEPLVLRAMELYPKGSNGNAKVQARTLDLVVTLVRCGVDFHRLDPKAALVACIQQQILGKRAYLKDPVRIMPSMYTFLGVLVTDDGAGPVDGNFLMQVVSPVFSSPYYRSNARLLPALRWMLRDLIVRRRMQLARSKPPPDVFADVRAHFLSCLVSKIPHEEAIDLVEALIRAARPDKSLVMEIAIPALKAFKLFASNGKMLVWKSSQYGAWKTLAARLLQQQIPRNILETATSATTDATVTLDPEDPNFVFAQICEPIDKLVGMLMLQKLDLAGEKAEAIEALQVCQADPKIASLAPELLKLLQSELQPAGAKRQLFNDEKNGNVENESAAATSPTSSATANTVISVDAVELLELRGLTSSQVLKPFASFDKVNLKEELPLLKVESVSSSAEIPDDLYPLHEALYAHAAKLLYLRQRLSRAELDQILFTAEALTVADPDHTVVTDRALENLRGAILRPAHVKMLTSSGQSCPVNDVFKITVNPLWKLEDEAPVAPAALADGRSVMWRYALSLSDPVWKDEEDSLIGMVPAMIPNLLPGVSDRGSNARAYGIVCRYIRSNPNLRTDAVIMWARQWLSFTRIAVLKDALSVLVDSKSDASSSMESHEEANMMLKNIVSPQVYCVDLPKLLLSSEFSVAQAVSILMSSLISFVREDVDLSPICHTILKVVPNLDSEEDLTLDLYLDSLKQTCPSENLFKALVVFLLYACDAETKDQAHRILHALHRGTIEVDPLEVCRDVEEKTRMKPLCAAVRKILDP
jgi:hypothetical protein